MAPAERALHCARESGPQVWPDWLLQGEEGHAGRVFCFGNLKNPQTCVRAKQQGLLEQHGESRAPTGQGPKRGVPESAVGRGVCASPGSGRWPPAQSCTHSLVQSGLVSLSLTRPCSSPASQPCCTETQLPACPLLPFLLPSSVLGPLVIWPSLLVPAPSCRSAQGTRSLLGCAASAEDLCRRWRERAQGQRGPAAGRVPGWLPAQGGTW